MVGAEALCPDRRLGVAPARPIRHRRQKGAHRRPIIPRIAQLMTAAGQDQDLCRSRRVPGHLIIQQLVIRSADQQARHVRAQGEALFRHISFAIRRGPNEGAAGVEARIGAQVTPQRDGGLYRWVQGQPGAAQFLAQPLGPEAPQTGPHQHHRGGGVEAQAREGGAVAGGPVVAVGGDQGHRIPQIPDQVSLGTGPLGATGKAMKIDDGSQRRGSGWGGLWPGPSRWPG